VLLPDIVAGVFLPTVFGLVVWAGLMVAQIVAGGDATVSPADAYGRDRNVRMREIRQVVRHHEYRLREASYRFDRTRGSHLPRLWMTDIAQRHN